MKERASSHADWEELCDGVTALAKGSGLTLEEVLESVRESYERVRINEGAKIEKSGLHMVLPNLLSDWSNSPAYVNNIGEPIDLRSKGPEPSIEHLVNTIARDLSVDRVENDVEEAINLLLIAESIQDVGEDRYRLVSNSYKTISDGAIHSVALMRSAAGYMKTMHDNIAQFAGLATGKFQRYAWSPRFPKKNIGILNALVNERGQEFLESIDRFLMEEHDEATEDTVYAGVGVYMYYDENLSSEEG